MILANSPDAVLGFDAEGRCIFAGGPTTALLGEDRKS
jgi:PAS domain-containing protein